MVMRRRDLMNSKKGKTLINLAIVRGTLDANSTNGWYYKGVGANNRAVINPIGVVLEKGKTYEIDFTNTSYMYSYRIVKPRDVDVNDLDFSITQGENKTIFPYTSSGYFSNVINVAFKTPTSETDTFTVVDDNVFLNINFKRSNNGEFTNAQLTTIQNNLKLYKL